MLVGGGEVQVTSVLWLLVNVNDMHRSMKFESLSTVAATWFVVHLEKDMTGLALQKIYITYVVREMRPVAMLCGHAAPIADLGICFPVEESKNGKLANSSNVPSVPNSVNCESLISACSDGVLCVWSRSSGHCRRRRKIPPWAGSPFMIRPLPDNSRYVCITCSSVSQEHELLDEVEGTQSSVDRELQNPNPSKCTVIIIDSFTLTIVQTVFHGNITIGPLKSMAVVLPSEDLEKQSVMIVDSFGKVLYLPIVKDTRPKVQNVPVVPKDSSLAEVMDWADDSIEKGSVLAFSKCGCVVALVHRTYCIFRQADNGTVLGKIPFSDDQLCFEDKLYVIGGVFLRDDTYISIDGFVEEFIAWNNRGAAVIYRISYPTNIFKFESLAVIPSYVLRVESICFYVEEQKFWRPHVTIWLLPPQNENYGKLPLACEMFAEGNFDQWVMDSSSSTTQGTNDDVLEEGTFMLDGMTPLRNSVLSPVTQIVNTQVVTDMLLTQELN
ncbi:UNVERIFIED_CONTAM: hypothetical protein Sangu_3162400 [Sesamum angustifolium]|uniref:Uncharacterized protein n=1 Tax=Sesamum angustifolium TaxID=2727405 RepID=A0AAW2JWL3_9LAMI